MLHLRANLAPPAPAPARPRQVLAGRPPLPEECFAHPVRKAFNVDKILSAATPAA